MPRQTRTSPREIASVEEAQAVLAQIGEADAKLTMLAKAAAQFVASMEQQAEDRAAPIREARDADVARLQAYFEANHKTLLKRKARSVRWPAGVVGFRRTPAKVEVAPGMEKTVMARLRKIGGKLIRQADPVIDKTAVLKYRDKLPQIAGLSFTRRTLFFVDPVESVVKIEAEVAPVESGGADVFGGAS